MKIGILCGREYSFPPAFIEKVNELGKKDGITAEFVKLGGTVMGELAHYTRHRGPHLARSGILPRRT